MADYATADDLITYGIAEQALGTIEDEVITKNLTAASRLADGYLRSRFALPLQEPYPADLVAHVCAIAAYRIIKVRGFDPESESDRNIRDDSKEAVRWLEQVAAEKIDPGVTDSSPEGDTFGQQGGPFVQTVVATGGSNSDGTAAVEVRRPAPRGW